MISAHDPTSLPFPGIRFSYFKYALGLLRAFERQRRNRYERRFNVRQYVMRIQRDRCEMPCIPPIALVIRVRDTLFLPTTLNSIRSAVETFNERTLFFGWSYSMSHA